VSVSIQFSSLLFAWCLSLCSQFLVLRACRPVAVSAVPMGQGARDTEDTGEGEQTRTVR
jgi:hypothetical protein